ncbi:MAG: M20 aminoacylase family protein [Gammaproteobacteria bacterium]|jgi:hippurate hydrolase|nr:MAG: amidohydrolase [Lautropia sp. SCN 70-15]
MTTLPPLIEENHAEFTAWRRDIHAHPELGFAESRTAELVATRLESFGIEVHRGVGRTGVVGVLRNGASPRTIGLRADMDALPIQEANTFDHRSRHDGRMHACGHDGHTAMLLGAAKVLASTRNFDGTVHFIFQPAEEGLGGAKAMVDDGLFERFPCESIFGMHNRPKLAVGRFAVRAGPMMAGGAFFDIDITGVGAHGARPESGVDPIVVGTQIASALQTIVSRNVAPVDTAVLSITQFHAGDAYNVIPQTARLSGTVRAFSNATMTMIGEHMKRTAEGVAQAMGATAKVDFRVNFAPTINDPAQAEFAAAVCAELVGAHNVERNPPLIMASEDFSFMLERVPGCYLNIGNGEIEGSCEVHNPAYDFNDEAIPLGVGFFVRAVEHKLARG